MGRGQGARKSDAGSAPNLRGSAAEEGSYKGNARHVIKVICGLLRRSLPRENSASSFFGTIGTCARAAPDQGVSDASLRLAMAQDCGARESVATSSDSPEPTP